MNRNLKAMGSTLTSIFVIGALFSSTASALYESESSSTTLRSSSSGTQKFQVKSGGTTIECSTLTFDNSTQSGKVVTTISVQPTIGACSNLFGQSVFVDTSSCEWVFHLADNETSGSTDIECIFGMKIKVGSLCTFEIGSQTSRGSVSYSNTGTSSTREVEFSFSLTGISSTRTTNHFPFLCPSGSTEGTWTGFTRVTGENGGNHTGFFVD